MKHYIESTTSVSKSLLSSWKEVIITSVNDQSVGVRCRLNSDITLNQPIDKNSESEEALFHRRYLIQKNYINRLETKFNLSYPEWREFWGEDIPYREGNPLRSMLRIDSSRPFEIGNIRMGVPRKPRKLDEAKIRAIRASDKKVRDIAEEFGLSPGTIYSVRRG